MSFLDSIHTLFSEKSCSICKRKGGDICLECLEKIQLYEPYCYICKKHSEGFYICQGCRKFTPFTQIIVGSRYRQTNLKKALKDAKYYGKKEIYKDIISFYEPLLKKHILYNKKNVFIPVPMFFLKRWKRGYNQADIIAKLLSERYAGRVEKNIIYKKRPTKSQSLLSEKKRLSNISGVFQLRKRNVFSKSEKIYIIDDIVSTGSTITELAYMLKNEGYKDIGAIILASD